MLMSWGLLMCVSNIGFSLGESWNTNYYSICSIVSFPLYTAVLSILCFLVSAWQTEALWQNNTFYCALLLSLELLSNQIWLVKLTHTHAPWMLRWLFVCNVLCARPVRCRTANKSILLSIFHCLHCLFVVSLNICCCFSIHNFSSFFLFYCTERHPSTIRRTGVFSKKLFSTNKILFVNTTQNVCRLSEWRWNRILTLDLLVCFATLLLAVLCVPSFLHMSHVHCAITTLKLSAIWVYMYMCCCTSSILGQCAVCRTPISNGWSQFRTLRI